MIVDESAIRSAAVSRRLQVDRVLPTEPARALLDPADPRVIPPSSPATVPPPQVAAAFPVGGIVVARVTADLVGQLLAAQVDDLPIELDWPIANGPAPKTGDSVPLRVVSLLPALTLQALVPQDGVEPSRWSLDPSRLQVVRFEQAWIAPETVSTSAAVPTPAAETVVAPAAPRRDAETNPFMPLVLQGPAWDGQPMELVVHRERADDGLDNPALDAWCGEVVIDLPHLGRVAGHLAFSMQGLRVRLEGDDAASVAAMTDAAADLATAFAGAGMRIAGVSVGGASPGIASFGGPIDRG